MSESTVPKRRLKPKPNYFLTIVSISLVLLLLGIFSIIMLHSRHVVKLFKEQINVIVELSSDLSSGEQASLFKNVYNLKGVLPQSAVYTSKDEAFDDLKKEMGEDLLLGDMANPLFNIFTFNVSEEYLHQDSLSGIREALISMDNRIKDVYFQETFIEEVTRNLEKIGYAFLILALLLSFIAVTLIHNTIKLGLYSNRMIIKNMELVGASVNFISWPFIKRGILHGVFSSIAAILVLSGMLYALYMQVPEILTILSREIILITFAGMLLLGVMINGLSTLLVVRKYLRMKMDDLF